MVKTYFENILKNYKAGDTTEASFYVVLQKFIENFSQTKKINLTITPQPKRTESGIPDFVIRKGKELIGYIEAKDIGKDLETLEHTEQIKKYKNDFDNFILTNYFDFWLWRRKEKKWILKTNLSTAPLVCLKVELLPPIINEMDFEKLLDTFLNFNIPERKTAKLLAQDLANKARLIPNFIVDELNNNTTTEIDRIYEAFKHFLIADLSKEQFADIYAQTIAYGLFMARLQHKGSGFNRFLAQQYLPKTITVLRDTFALISGPNLPNSLSWIVDDIATILAYCDIEKIKNDLKEKTGGNDPLIHFYETFLKEYNPKEKKHMGVYYTPMPVVSYITNSINILLKEKFNKSLGFADETVTILDPASGTLTFPAKAIEIAKNEIEKSDKAGVWLDIVKNHILKHYYGFELLMAPYVIGHLKASLLLEELGYKMQDDDRFNLFLTNSLDFEQHEQSNLPGFPFALTEESKNALEVKNQKKILVVMGNPPYSVSSSNIIKSGTDFQKFYDSYKEKVRKEEKNIQPLSDDYIKFIAFAHWKISQQGQGIVGMITNNSYLDGLIHRDIREKLSEDFNEIYILNLHGSSKRNEKTTQGGRDENVFDIQQGVSIILLVKLSENIQKVKSKIRYFDLSGLREDKYKFLETHNIKNTKWQILNPKKPAYFLVPKDFRDGKEYHKFLSLKDVFLQASSGVKTHRDDFILGNSKDALRRRLSMFIDIRNSNDQFQLKETKNWAIDKARTKIKKEGIKEDLFRQYNYRPFDVRWIYKDRDIVERMRDEYIWDLGVENPALVSTKQISTDSFRHCFVTELPTDICFASLQTKENAYIFPLYTYEENLYGNGKKKIKLPAGVMMLFDAPKQEEKKPNIKPEIMQKLGETYAKKVAPEDIFYYIYGVLYSNVYRQKYREFLKIDFPKVPFTSNVKLFFEIGKMGKELANLHLLKSPKLEKLLSKFPVSIGNALTDGLVKKREYNGEQKRIYINDQQYFENITLEIWNYYIGGYQVLDKWLKDKIGKILSSQEVEHYLKIITTIKNTIVLQKKIDELYLEVEKDLIKF